jgi:hypothetical protein
LALVQKFLIVSGNVQKRQRNDQHKGKNGHAEKDFLHQVDKGSQAKF